MVRAPGKTPIITFKVPDADPEQVIIRKAEEVAVQEIQALLTALSSLGLEAHPLLAKEIMKTSLLVKEEGKLFPALVVERAMYSLDPDRPPVIVAAALGWAERRGRVVSGWVDSALLLRVDGGYLPISPRDLLTMYSQLSSRAVIIESGLLRIREWELYIMRLKSKGWTVIIVGDGDVPPPLEENVIDPSELDANALSREYGVVLAYLPEGHPRLISELDKSIEIIMVPI